MCIKKDVLQHLVELWRIKDLKKLCSFCNVYIYTGYQGIRGVQEGAQGVCDHATPIVVKINFDYELFAQEARALEFFQGYGAVRLIDVDMQSGALLLERVMPGSSLKTCFPHDDLNSVRFLVALIKKLQSVPLIHLSSVQDIKNPCSEPLLTVADWLQGVDKEYLFFHAHLVKARLLADSLLKTQKQAEIFLHGDLHHDNVLLGADGTWIAIDPKGVLGDPAYEVGAFMRNPLPELLTQPDVKDILRARLELFSNLLEIDQQRLRDWSYVQAVLAACWAIEDGVEYASFIAVAQLFDEL